MTVGEATTSYQPKSLFQPVAVSSASSLESYMFQSNQSNNLNSNELKARMHETKETNTYQINPAMIKSESGDEERPTSTPLCSKSATPEARSTSSNIGSSVVTNTATSSEATTTTPSQTVNPSSTGSNSNFPSPPSNSAKEQVAQSHEKRSTSVPNVAPQIAPNPSANANVQTHSHLANVQPKKTENRSSTATSIISPAIVPAPMPVIFNSTNFPTILPQVSMLHDPTSVSAMVANGASVSNSIPEFVYQLTKMLTDDNREVIEWSHGKIEVHNPHKLETDVLKKYFRHSKFASFQRQLNYFGFRKLAGKGKMAPCSYVNDSVSGDISNLLMIKRKVSTVPTKENPKKRAREEISEKSAKGKPSDSAQTPPVNPVLAGIFNRSKDVSNQNTTTPIAPDPKGSTDSLGGNSRSSSTYQALAQQAVGRGIRHSFLGSTPMGSTSSVSTSAPQCGNTTTPTSTPSNNIQDFQPKPQVSTEAQKYLSENAATAAVDSSTFDFKDMNDVSFNDSLSQLESNYRNSLNQSYPDLSIIGDTNPTPLSQMQSSSALATTDNSEYESFFLSRNSSLIDLAMIAPVEETLPDQQLENSNMDDSGAFGFIDFPNPEVYPKPSQSGDGDTYMG